MERKIEEKILWINPLPCFMNDLAAPANSPITGTPSNAPAA